MGTLTPVSLQEAVTEMVVQSGGAMQLAWAPESASGGGGKLVDPLAMLGPLLTHFVSETLVWIRCDPQTLAISVLCRSLRVRQLTGKLVLLGTPRPPSHEELQKLKTRMAEMQAAKFMLHSVGAHDKVADDHQRRAARGALMAKYARERNERTK